jgi:hypothetical protein
LSPRPKMRPQDGGLVTLGVWVMRDDDARMSRDVAVRVRARELTRRRSGCCGSGQATGGISVFFVERKQEICTYTMVGR